MLSVLELSPGDLAEPDLIVPGELMIRLWALFTKRLPNCVVPLDLAGAFSPRELGLVGHLMWHSGTLREALRRFVRYQTIAAPHLALTVEHGPHVTAIVYRHHITFVHQLGLPVEFGLAMLQRQFERLCGTPLAPREVTFSHAARYPVSPYEAFFRTGVRFEQPRDALLFDNDVLDGSIRESDPGLLRYLEAHATRLLAALPPVEAPIVNQVRRLLSVQLDGEPPTLATVARRLAMSTRTLHRRLAAAGTSFQSVLTEVRYTSALRLLREETGNPTDVAFMLGYADLPSFYRAFKRWTGQTPQQWRTANRAL
ncbi:AraC family transcriptional regulator [Pendulispora brunnea]|uniref:AraC family transcriptional regulator n=2 Tax=Pendulispora brunnea TaxID=2905690 RepID=A0ABZ2KK61_9BACT